MSTPATIAVIVTAAWIGFSAFSLFTRKAFVVDNLVAYGVSPHWWTPLSALKALGATGLVVGLWAPGIGIAAAVGLVLYFAGAVAVILHARSFGHVPFPLLYLVPAATTIWLLA
jgi:hypothetical protein